MGVTCLWLRNCFLKYRVSVNPSIKGRLSAARWKVTFWQNKTITPFRTYIDKLTHAEVLSIFLRWYNLTLSIDKIYESIFCKDDTDEILFEIDNFYLSITPIAIVEVRQQTSNLYDDVIVIIHSRIQYFIEYTVKRKLKVFPCRLPDICIIASARVEESNRVSLNNAIGMLSTEIDHGIADSIKM